MGWFSLSQLEHSPGFKIFCGGRHFSLCLKKVSEKICAFMVFLPKQNKKSENLSTKVLFFNSSTSDQCLTAKWSAWMRSNNFMLLPNDYRNMRKKFSENRNFARISRSFGGKQSFLHENCRRGFCISTHLAKVLTYKNEVRFYGPNFVLLTSGQLKFPKKGSFLSKVVKN